MQVTVVLSENQIKRLQTVLKKRQQANSIYKRSDVLREVIEAGLSVVDEKKKR